MTGIPRGPLPGRAEELQGGPGRALRRDGATELSGGGPEGRDVVAPTASRTEFCSIKSSYGGFLKWGL